MGHTYKDKALALFDAGFEPIPLNGKRPVITDWTTIDITRERVEKWAANGTGGCNVGIRCTDFVQALDFDIDDEHVSFRMHEKARPFWGLTIAPRRIGRFPRFLMVLHVEGLPAKLTSNEWVDQHGVVHKIEVLTKGQQFAVFGPHPDTKIEYEWQNDTPEHFGVAKLPTITMREIESLFRAFDEEAKRAGWTLVKGGSKRPGKKRAAPNDPAGDEAAAALANLKTPGATIEELRRALFRLPMSYCDDREYWVEAGAIIHWETQGSEEGYRLYDAWSRLSPKYKNQQDTRRRWASFRLDRDPEQTATFGTLVAWLEDEGLDVDDLTGDENSQSSQSSQNSQQGDKNSQSSPNGAEKSQGFTSESQENSQRKGLVAGEVRRYIAESDDEFSTNMIYQDLSLKNKRDKDAARTALVLFCKQGIIEKVQGKRGWYVPMATDDAAMDFSDVKTAPYPIWLPLGLSQYVNMLGKQIAIIAGSTNAGKTSFVFHLLEVFVWSFVSFFAATIDREKLRHSLRECTVSVLPTDFAGEIEKKLINAPEWEPPEHVRPHLIDFGDWKPGQDFSIRYLNVEMGASELVGRLVSLGPLSAALMFCMIEWKNTPRNWHKHVNPHGLNVVDYLSKYDDFYTMGGDIDKIHQRLDDDGLAFILIQKREDMANPRGGEFVLERCRLAVNLDKNPPYGCIATLRKVKHPVNYKRNPEGQQVDYKIDDHGRLRRMSELAWVDKKERKRRNEMYERELRAGQNQEAARDFGGEQPPF